MIQTSEIKTDDLVKALRVLATDLCDKSSPFSKNEEYMKNLSAWLMTAATRLEKEKL